MEILRPTHEEMQVVRHQDVATESDLPFGVTIVCEITKSLVK